MLPLSRKNSLSKRLVSLIVVLALLMLATANFWGVVESSEARYAEVSREMLRSGDWLHPTLMNIYHYHKPPVTYWLTAASYAVFGVNPFAARFFLTIAFCVQVFLIYRIAQHLFRDEQIAYYAALIYATLPIVLISVRGLTTDAYLTTFVLLAVYWWIRFLESRKAMFLYGMATAIGLGFLTKGPVVLVVPVFAIIGLTRWYPPAPVRVTQIAAAFLIFATLSFSWFIFLAAENPRFTDYFFYRHFVDRIAHAEVFSRAEPWYYYLPVIPVIYVPWIAMALPRRRDKKAHRHEDHDKLTKRLAVWWFLGPLLIFSLSTSKLVLYILPLSIGFSLVAGYFLASGRFKPLFWVFLPIFVLVYIGLIAAPFFPPGFAFNTALMVIPVAALVISVGIIFLRLTKNSIISIWSFLFAASLILYASLFFRLNGIAVNTVRPMAGFIKEHGLNERDILVYDELLPALSFELDKDIISVYAGHSTLKRETEFQNNDQWNDFLINGTDGEGLMKVKSELSKKAVLITKKKLSAPLDTVMTGEWNEKKFGNWVLYYN